MPDETIPPAKTPGQLATDEGGRPLVDEGGRPVVEGKPTADELDAADPVYPTDYADEEPAP